MGHEVSDLEYQASERASRPQNPQSSRLLDPKVCPASLSLSPCTSVLEALEIAFEDFYVLESTSPSRDACNLVTKLFR